jgi:hypothetical protein
MAKVVVIGGGWAGCAAALSAKKAGAEVVLVEKTDCLLGTGLVGGIMRNNGRFTAAEEMVAMGGGDLFRLTDQEPTVARYLAERAIGGRTVSRAQKIKMTGQKIEAVQLETGQLIEGDVFVDATGTLGPQGNCRKYGNGCAMCIIRCPSFGGRVSIAGLAGVKEMRGRRPDGGYGAMSGSCKLNKDSLDPGLVAEMERTGVAVVPVPEELAEQKSKLLGIKSCQQYALKEFAENVVLLDTGHAKLMSPFYPLADLRSIPGLENARYEDPYAGGKGNSIRYLAMSPRDNFLKVEGVDNLFCGGEKAGLLVGHTEAITTGTLAGHNAVRYVVGKPLLELPISLAVGDAIAYVREQMQTEEGLMQKYTFSGSVYFERMKELGLHTTDENAIRERVKEAGLSDVFAQKVT